MLSSLFSAKFDPKPQLAATMGPESGAVRIAGKAAAGLNTT